VGGPERSWALVSRQGTVRHSGLGLSAAGGLVGGRVFLGKGWSLVLVLGSVWVACRLRWGGVRSMSTALAGADRVADHSAAA